jgi:hypothetical protein
LAREFIQGFSLPEQFFFVMAALNNLLVKWNALFFSMTTGVVGVEEQERGAAINHAFIGYRKFIIFTLSLFLCAHISLNST